MLYGVRKPITVYTQVENCNNLFIKPFIYSRTNFEQSLIINVISNKANVKFLCGNVLYFFISIAENELENHRWTKYFHKN